MLGNQGHLTRKASGFPVQYINISLDLQEKDLCLKAKLEMKTWKLSKPKKRENERPYMSVIKCQLVIL